MELSKKDFIKTKLEPLLKECGFGVKSIDYQHIAYDGIHENEFALIEMDCGYLFRVNIHMDSHWAIVKDVVHGFMREFNI